MAEKSSPREQFIQKAVPYYVLGLAVAFGRKRGETAYTKADIEREEELQLPTQEVFERAVEICCKVGLIQRHEDDFGPVSFSPQSNSGEARKKLEATYDVFEKYGRQRNHRAWLQQAIREIDRRWQSVRYLRTDEEQPDVWQPIPIEREEVTCRDAIASLDKAAEAVRADNGYNSTHGEERRYVLDHLAAAQKRLKEDAQIAWMYLKEFVLDPLTVVIKRFGKAATGLAASEARDALLKWLRERAGDILRGLLG